MWFIGYLYAIYMLFIGNTEVLKMRTITSTLQCGDQFLSNKLNQNTGGVDVRHASCSAIKLWNLRISTSSIINAVMADNVSLTGIDHHTPSIGRLLKQNGKNIVSGIK